MASYRFQERYFQFEVLRHNIQSEQVTINSFTCHSTSTCIDVIITCFLHQITFHFNLKKVSVLHYPIYSFLNIKPKQNFFWWESWLNTENTLWNQDLYHLRTKNGGLSLRHFNSIEFNQINNVKGIKSFDQNLWQLNQSLINV